MKSALTALALCSLAMAAPTAEEFSALLNRRPEADEIQWKDPARGSLKVRIVRATPQAVTVVKSLPAGTTTREVPLVDLARISFSFTPAEASLHRDPEAAAAPALRVLWDARQATLAIPGSNAGETGIALAKSLRLAGGTPAFDEAARLLDRVIARDPDQRRTTRAAAEADTLAFARLAATAKPEEIDKAAWKITEAPENTDAMLLATRFLAERHFAELRQIETAHPRWIEDDEVRPQRDRVYQLALDFSLYPSLFAGTRVPESADGLRRVSDIHRFCGESGLERMALEDLAALYPESAPARETAPRLALLREPAEPAPDDVPSTTTGAAAPAPEPPPPPAKRYNIFVD